MLDYWTVQIGGEVGKDPAAQAFTVPQAAGDYEAMKAVMVAICQMAAPNDQIQITLQFHKAGQE